MTVHYYKGLKQIIIFSWLSFLAIATVSCSDDDGPSGAPLAIAAINPAKARVGDTVVIEGTGFNPDKTQNQVFFEPNVAVSGILEATATTLKVRVPATAATGPVVVRIGNKEVSSPSDFTVDDSPLTVPPVITKITPASGHVGTELLVEGSEFAKAGNGKVMKVLFGTIEATEIYDTDEQYFKVIVPDGVTPGTVQVTVVVDDVASATGFAFTVTELIDAPALYWTQEDGGVYKATFQDGKYERELLYSAEEGASAPRGIKVDKDNGILYFVDQAQGALLKADVSGNGSVTVLYDGSDGMSAPLDLAIDFENGVLYLTDGDKIYTGSINGRAAQALSTLYDLSGSGAPFGIKLAAGSDAVYWVDINAQTVSKGTKDHAEPIVLFDGGDGLELPSNIAVDETNNAIYIVDYKVENLPEGSIEQPVILKGALTAPAALTPIFEGENSIGVGYWTNDLEIDTATGYLYWMKYSTADTSEGYIYRGNLSTGQSERLLENVSTGSFFDVAL